MDNHHGLTTHHFMICCFNKHISERIVAMEIQFRFISKRAQLGESSQLAILGRIHQNNKEVVVVQITSPIDCNTICARNNKRHILIGIVFYGLCNWRSIRILDSNNKHNLDQIRLSIRCRNGNRQGRIRLHSRWDNNKRILQRNLIQSRQVFHQRN